MHTSPISLIVVIVESQQQSETLENRYAGVGPQPVLGVNGREESPVCIESIIITHKW